MALVTEDGTGQATAESYISIADASTYHNARGAAAWDLLTDAVKEESLRKATEFMIERYRGRIKGVRLLATQALDWPRSGVYLDAAVSGYIEQDDDEVPEAWERACAILALKSNTETLSPDLTRQKNRVKVGPIETEFDAYAQEEKRFTAVDAMLEPFLENPSGFVETIRA